MTLILELENLTKAFGAVVVADRLSFGLEEGEALGILGPNGAGKTSVFNLITGVLPPDSGRIRFKGADVTRTNAAQRCRAGIARSFQVPQPFTGLTVFENTMVAATQAANLKGHQAEQLCIQVLEDTDLISKANVRASSLTLLDRKRLELSRALCAKPGLLLLDEIAGGLTESECVSLIKTIKDIRERGVSIIWIEHVVHALLSVVDKLLVINFGKLVVEGNPAETMATREVQEIYLGIETGA